jgi:hypothetical protein
VRDLFNQFILKTQPNPVVSQQLKKHLKEAEIIENKIRQINM